MTNQHPITPPPELVNQWCDEDPGGFEIFDRVATKAARWGADQELEACCKWLECNYNYPQANPLRTARRPKPQSLKEQALKALHTSVDLDDFPKQYDTIRRALEALPE